MNSDTDKAQTTQRLFTYGFDTCGGNEEKRVEERGGRVEEWPGAGKGVEAELGMRQRKREPCRDYTFIESVCVCIHVLRWSHGLTSVCQHVANSAV